MENSTADWAGALVSVELADPGSALSKALNILGDSGPLKRELYIAFYRLGVVDGAYAQTIRSAELMEPGA